jgi:DNA-binding NarL/FixJ family response regulator
VLRLAETFDALGDREMGEQLVRLAERLAAVPETIRKTSPKLLCFEYDYPELSGLRALQQAKRDHAGLPILMLTEYHSEALAGAGGRGGRDGPSHTSRPRIGLCRGLHQPLGQPREVARLSALRGAQ